MAHEQNEMQKQIAELSKLIREHLDGLENGPGTKTLRLATNEEPLLVALSQMVLLLAEKHGS
ncbi:hypothetical protein [Methylobacterium sp. CM6257]